MKKLTLAVAVALPLLAAFSPASAQKLEVGKWTGTVTEPGGEAHPVTYDVTMKGDTVAITVDAGEHGRYPFSEVKLNDRTLSFWFTPGPRVDCTLARRDDGAYEGTCRDAGGEEARMLMTPPKKE